jgi:glucan phosphoethanolaminetransferase (alkaline phosphatase superfamily)
MVNKACFRKSIIGDFVFILTIIVSLIVVVIGCLMLNALVPILTPFGSAYNWVIVSYGIILFLACSLPLTGKPDDLKEFPTIGLIVVGYLVGAMPFVLYCTISLREHNFPDILMLICVPISMGYARCRNE